jgi:hypothetical protein
VNDVCPPSDASVCSRTTCDHVFTFTGNSVCRSTTRRPRSLPIPREPNFRGTKRERDHDAVERAGRTSTHRRIGASAYRRIGASTILRRTDPDLRAVPYVTASAVFRLTGSVVFCFTGNVVCYDSTVALYFGWSLAPVR